MRPQLNPALPTVWRDETTLQLGLDPGRAVAIGGLDAASTRLVRSLDGTRDLTELRAVARELGLGAERAERLLALLEECGALEDAAADHGSIASLSPDDRDRLAPDLAAATLVRRTSDGGAAVLAARRSAAVGVHGAGRVGASTATMLAAAGVGTITVHDRRIAAPADLAPAGVSATDLGTTRQEATSRALRRASPSVRQRLPRGQAQPDLAIVCGDEAATPSLTDRLVREGTPHLFATVREGTGLVGPLVLPGRSSCLRCHHLHRTDRDPAWPSIAAQLAGRATAEPTACDVVLATAVAAHAALQALAFLDGAKRPPAVDGTIEIRQADGVVRRRSWAPHPACGCTWTTA